ncbi:MAG: hypothetical protein M3328_16795 [Chloroflexota bacterium]|nr:hypothetical protein [Chloroflexota bacterium]
MKTNYKRLAPFILLLLAVMILISPTIRRDFPEWGATAMYIVQGILIVIGGTLVLVPGKDD